MANEFVTRTGLIVSGSTYLPSATSASKGYILSFDDSTKQVYYMSTSSVTVTVPGSDTQIIYNNGGAFGAASNFVFSGSRVGINKTSPSTTLDISGSVLISGSLTVSGSSTFTNIGPAVFTGSITQNASTASFGGLVGIGTTTPAYKLDVNSDAIRFGDGGSAVFYMNVVNDPSVAGHINVGGSNRISILGSGNVGVGTSTPNSTFQVSKGGVTFQVTDTNKNTSNTFSVYGLSQTSWAIATGNSGSFSGGEKIVIADSGNIGIGVDNPSYKLQANGNIAATNSTGSGLFSISGTRSIAVQSFSGDWNYLRSNGANLVFGTQDSANLYIRTNDTDRMIVTTAGNVGIGTASPSEILDVQKAGTVAIRVYNTSSTADAYFDAKNSTGNAFFGINATGQYLYTSNNIPTLFYNSGSERMRLTSDGHLILKSMTSGGGTQGDFYVIENGGLVIDASEGATQRYIEFTTGGTQKMLITAGGDIGIGTGSPTAKLDVRTDTGILIKGATSDTDGRVSIIPASGGRQYDLRNYGSSFGIKDASADVVRMFFHNNGNTGIANGTTTPTDTLQVEGGRISVTNGSTFGLSIEASGSGGRGGIISTKAGSDWNPVMYFTSQSRVGIGTGAPATTLDVSGTGRFSGDVTVGLGNALENLVIINGQTYSGVRFQRSSTTKWAIFNNNAGTDFIDFYNYSTNSSAFYISPTNAATFAAGVTATSFTGSFSGSVSAPGSTTQIVYNNGGALAGASAFTYNSSNSNVGIGSTPASNERLRISTPLNDWGVMFVTGSTTTGGIHTNNNVLTLQADNADYINLEGANVGIGTTTPGEVLEVVGNIRANVSNGGGFMLTGASASGLVRAGATGLALRTNTTDRLTIDNSGNVGIGITSPSSRLHVADTGESVITLQDLDGTNQLLNIGHNGGGSYFLSRDNTSNGNFSWYTYDGTTLSTRMYIAPGGNVGIGTTSPGQKLTLINGTFQIGGTSTFSDNIEIGRVGSDNNMAFATGGTERMRITSTGNVGIGTTSPTSQFHIYNNNTYSAANINETTGSLMAFKIRTRAGVDTNIVMGAFDSTQAGLQVVDINASASTQGFLINPYGGNVGIGVTSPTYNLEVSGSGYISGSLTVAGTITAQKLNVQQITSSVIYSSGSNIFGNSLANTQTFTGSLQVTGSTHYLLGNVGIGTTSPNRILDVNGVIRTQNAGSAGAPSIELGTSAQGNGLFSPTTNTLAFTTNDAERMRIDSTGNLMLGVTSVYGGGAQDAKFTMVGGAPAADAARGNMILMDTKAYNASPLFSIMLGGQFNSSNSTTFFGGIAGGKENATDNDYAGFLSLYTRANGGGRSEAVRITSAGNVGIGTTSPSEKLVVNASSGANSIIYAATDTGQAGLKLLAGTGATNRATRVDFLNGVASGTVPRWTLINDYNQNGTNDFRFVNNDQSTSVLTLLQGGNVGIGTANPAVKLDIQGSNTGTSLGDGMFLKLKNTSTTANTRAGIVFGNIDGIGGSLAMQSAILKNAATGEYDMTWDLYGGSAGWQEGLLYLDSNPGRVGIGTTSPGAKLDVNGEVYVSPNTAGKNTFVLTTNASNDGRLLIKSDTTTKVDIQANGTSYFNGGNVGIGTSSPSAKLEVTGNIYANESSATAISVYNSNSIRAKMSMTGNEGDLTLYGSSANAVIYLSAYYNSYFNGGNVGIGTTSPAGKLTVKSPGEVSSYGDGFVLERNANSAKLVRIYESGADGYLEVRTGNNDIISKLSGYSGTSSYFLSSVGIGTTTPNAKLDLGTSINGNYRASFFMYNDNTAGIYHGTKNGFYMDQFGLSNNTLLSFSTAASAPGTLMLASKNTDISSSAALTPRMTILGESGNVGIGTSSPNNILHLYTNYAGSSNSGSAITITSDGSGGDNGWIGVNKGTGNGLTLGVENRDIIFQTDNTTAFNGTERMRITTDGNVGIGTASPNGKLQVNGRIYTVGTAGTANAIFQGGQLEFYKDATPTYAASIGLSGPSSGGTNDIVFETYGGTWSERMRIATGGNVGIGTTSPAYKLQVSGSIAIENQGTTTIESTTFSGSLTGNTNIAFVPTGSFKAAFFDYYVASGSISMRAGTIMAVQNNSTSRYTDTSTADIGNTAPVDFSTSVVGGNLVLTANIASGTWEIKTAYRAL
jgi:hypothetical protein